MLFILLFLKSVLGTTCNFFSDKCQRMHPILLENVAFIALFNLNHIRKYLKELNSFLIFNPGNISSRSKQGSQPDPLEILYKEGDILNIKVCVNWILQLLFYNEKEFYHIALLHFKLDFLLDVTGRLKICPRIPKGSLLFSYNIKTKGISFVAS